MGQKILGSCVVKVDGISFLTVPDSVEISFGGRAREAVVADDDVHYRDGPLVPSMLSCEFLHSANTDIKKLNDLVNGLVECITDIGSGITYTIPNATRTGLPIKSSSSNGRIAFQCEGKEVPGL